jgi:hypothetical protein
LITFITEGATEKVYNTTFYNDMVKPCVLRNKLYYNEYASIFSLKLQTLSACASSF